MLSHPRFVSMAQNSCADGEGHSLANFKRQAYGRKIPRLTSGKDVVMRKSTVDMVLIACACMCASSPAQSHEWYPKSCCDDRDCTKVDRTEYLSDGRMIFFGRLLDGTDIKVIIPRGFRFESSPDENMHVCVWKWSKDATGVYKPRDKCVFAPGSS